MMREVRTLTPFARRRLREMTYDLAHAAGMDAGNRSMRKAGRVAWNEDDADAMWAEFNRLWPEET